MTFELRVLHSWVYGNKESNACNNKISSKNKKIKFLQYDGRALNFVSTLVLLILFEWPSINVYFVTIINMITTRQNSSLAFRLNYV